MCVESKSPRPAHLRPRGRRAGHHAHVKRLRHRRGRTLRAALSAWTTLAALLAALPVPAFADSEPFFTRYSAFRIVDRGHHLQELVSDGRKDNWHPDWPVPGTEAWRLLVESKFPWRPDADVIVLARLEVSNACWARFQFIVVSEKGYPRASKPSESCPLGLIAMRVSHEKIELDTSTRRPDLSHVTLRFDGEAIQELEVPRDDSGAQTAGAGPEVTRWIGVHPSLILDESSERRRFATIMDREDLYELVRNTRVSDSANARLVDRVLVAWGCRAHECPDAQAAIAIEVATGRPYAVICTHERGSSTFGGAPDELPEHLQAIAARCPTLRATE